MEYLRRSVAVDLTQDPVGVRYGFWSLELPRDWVLGTDGLEQFLSGDSPLATVELSETEASNFANILRVSGCLTRSRKDRYTLSEVHSLFIPLCISWHAHYYDHPLWTRLREGRLSRNALVAWVIYNYHLSQSAGVTAARCATRSPRPDVRRLFLDSAIEEYSHCRDYYRIDDARLGVSLSDALNYVHLPASLAFDQQMFRLAEDDWLAHVLVGYFQESTSSYFTQCAEFYDDVERRYDLAGFFDGWKGHMRLDIDFGHASAFGEALESDEQVSAQQLEASLRNTAITVQMLTMALDQILATDRLDDVIALRRPLTVEASDCVNNDFVAGSKKAASWNLTSARNARDVLATLHASGLLDRQAGIDLASPGIRTFVESELADSLCRALSYARSEPQLLALGRLVEISRDAFAVKSEQSAWFVPDVATGAAMNFIREAALQTHEIAACVLHLQLVLPAGQANDMWIQQPEARTLISDLAASCPVDGEEAARLATRLVQFDELLREPDSTWISKIQVDVLR